MQYSSSKSSDSVEYLYDDFGQVVPMSTIKKDMEGFLFLFCEGSFALKSLLRTLWSHDIVTAGCCTGHPGVNSYTKDTLFGGRKMIDEYTYRRHANSDRYHHYQEPELYAYMAIRLSSIGNAELLCDKIGKDFSERMPELPVTTYIGERNLVISMDEYIPERKREAFFTVLSDSLQNNISLFKTSNKVVAEQIKAPLDHQIEAAEKQAAAQAVPSKAIVKELGL